MLLNEDPSAAVEQEYPGDVEPHMVHDMDSLTDQQSFLCVKRH